MRYSSHGGRLRSSGRAWMRAICVQNCRQLPGRGRAMCAHVVLEVEPAVPDPPRTVETERHVDHPLAEALGDVQAGLDVLEHLVLGRRTARSARTCRRSRPSRWCCARVGVSNDTIVQSDPDS